jgi:hypothetical protein
VLNIAPNNPNPAPRIMNTALNPATKRRLLLTRINLPLPSSPAIKARYEGMRGRIHGEIKEVTPARNAIEYVIETLILFLLLI